MINHGKHTNPFYSPPETHTTTRRSFLKLGSAGVTAAALGIFNASTLYAQTNFPRCIDIHAHYYPEKYLRSLAEEGGPPGFSVEYPSPGAPVLISNGTRLQLDVTYWDLEKRIARMNEQGVTTQALSLSQPMTHLTAPERGAHLAKIFNDALIEAHKAYPDRFVGCATLPLQDTDLTLKEIDRIAGEKAIRGVYMPTSFIKRELNDETLFPVYKRCEEASLPVLLHPLTVIGADRLHPYYLLNLLGNPYDTGAAAAYLVFGGVMDKFPKLEIVLPHAGGTLPYLVGRLQHGQEVRAEDKDAAKLPFSDYLRRFHYDTITHSPELLRFLIGEVGADRVMIGSDYCFDMGVDHPRDVVLKLNLNKADREKIFFSNAAALLKI